MSCAFRRVEWGSSSTVAKDQEHQTSLQQAALKMRMNSADVNARFYGYYSKDAIEKKSCELVGVG